MSERPDAAVADLLVRFPRERTWLLPALQAVQELLGHLPEWALAATGAHLRVPASEVYGVATHYPELRLSPRGEHHVRVCTGVSCALSGGQALLDAVGARYAVTAGESGAERELTLERTDCFFECAVAPLIEVDGALHGRATLADVARLDGWFTARAPHPSGTATEARPPAPVSAGSAAAFLEQLRAAATARRRARPALRLVVQAGSCGRAVGAESVLAAMRQAVAARSLDAEVVAGACNGMCYAAPAIEVQREGWPRFVIERLDASAVPVLLERLRPDGAGFASADLTGVVWTERPWRDLTPVAEHPFWKSQERLLMARCGSTDPEDVDDALALGAYRALAQALDRPPGELIESVRAAGLQGRGGAFFPTAAKWQACRAAAGEPKYVVVNGEEGEPGIFKDRHLMEGDPHQLLEGALLAAYAAGATRVILYVHGEADLSAARLTGAVRRAETAGIVGERMLGSGVSCHVELRRGAGGFVLGEETALLESIEGRRAQPRTRPPFPVESGLWGKPTVVNNAETLSAIPAILTAGPGPFAALGTPKAPGTKVFGLSGPIRRPGVVETRNGVTLRALLEEIGGGLADGHALQGAVVGGPSGTIVPATLFDVPMEPRERVSPGTGGIVAVPATASVAEIVETLLRFNAVESCGKCTPCREGTPRLLAMIRELRSPGGEPRLADLRELAETIQLASLCGLGQAAPLAILRGLETFPQAFGVER
jgi:NADH:ubiquinone oxidoreductase subunit F (NADH-binding)/NADH:ubiquinone oxidoreductase subunit E